jgi:hypothetical protein
LRGILLLNDGSLQNSKERSLFSETGGGPLVGEETGGDRESRVCGVRKRERKKEPSKFPTIY